jgi:adenylosuccinate synthase
MKSAKALCTRRHSVETGREVSERRRCAATPHDQRDHKQRQKHHEKQPGNIGRGCCNATKAERLHEKGHALKDEAKARWKEKMADLEAKQQVARDKLEEVRKSTAGAWGHVEKGAQAAWDDVRKAFQEAAEEF